jgi:hypothetical protein
MIDQEVTNTPEVYVPRVDDPGLSTEEEKHQYTKDELIEVYQAIEAEKKARSEKVLASIKGIADFLPNVTHSDGVTMAEKNLETINQLMDHENPTEEQAYQTAMEQLAVRRRLAPQLSGKAA